MEKLEVLLEPLTANQSQFLILRILGENATGAMKLMGINDNAVYQWRSAADFKRAEDTILSHKVTYVEEASAIFFDRLAVRTAFNLSHLIEKALEWDTLEAREKSICFRAVELVAKLNSRGIKRIGLDKESYDDRIMKGRSR